jgi:two-component system phosphate regulon response regulator PhoB
VFVVAETDDRVRSFLAGQLSADGAEVFVADDRRQARARCTARCPDVLLLGALDGPAAGMELLREIRSGDGLHGQPHPGVPVLVRGGLPRSRVGELEVDSARRPVTVHGEPVDMSAREFALLCALVAEPTRVLTKDELLGGVWGFRSPGRTRTLDSHACRLRSKLSAAGAGGMVVNVRASGTASSRWAIASGGRFARWEVGWPDLAFGAGGGGLGDVSRPLPPWWDRRRESLPATML